MEIREKILNYLLIHGEENKYRIASALKISAWEVTRALSVLEEEGKIEIKNGKIIPLKVKEIYKKKKEEIQKTEEAQKEELEEEQAEEVIEKREEIEERPEETETIEETQAKEELEEEQPETPIEEVEKVSEEPAEERIEGTVKFFNPNKGFGFITADDGKEYYVHESGLKEGVTIEANDRVSFKVVQGDRGPKAEEVEWVSQA